MPYLIAIRSLPSTFTSCLGIPWTKNWYKPLANLNLKQEKRLIFTVPDRQTFTVVPRSQTPAAEPPDRVRTLVLLPLR